MEYIVIIFLLLLYLTQISSKPELKQIFEGSSIDL